MNKLYVASLASLAWTVPGTAQQVTRRANIIGNEVDGKCTIEVSVYGALKSRCKATSARCGICLANGRCGAASCATGVCPKIRTTSDFAESTDAAMFNSFGIHGRTAVELSFGSMIRMAAREGYTVDLEWRGSNGGQWTNQDTRGWRGPDNRDGNQGNFGDGRGPDDANRDRRYYDEQGRWNSDGPALAIRVCEAAATERIQRDGFETSLSEMWCRTTIPGGMIS